MSNETMTAPEVFRMMAENAEQGKFITDGILTDGSLASAHASPALLCDFAAQGRITRAPRYIEVAGVQVPEPMRVAPVEGAICWTLGSDGRPAQFPWRGSRWDCDRLADGRVFATKEGAMARAEAERRLFGASHD